jgi:hypothetical protein
LKGSDALKQREDGPALEDGGPDDLNDDDDEVKKDTRTEAEKMEDTMDATTFGLLKTVMTYYDLWAAPPSNHTKVAFMTNILMPMLPFERVKASLDSRGFPVDRCVFNMSRLHSAHLLFPPYLFRHLRFRQI